MELSIEQIRDTLKLTIGGESLSMQNAMDFKKQLAAMVSKNMPSKISVLIQDAYALPSSIIGALLKYKEIEKIEIELLAKKAELVDSLSGLSLAEILNARSY